MSQLGGYFFGRLVGVLTSGPSTEGSDEVPEIDGGVEPCALQTALGFLL